MNSLRTFIASLLIILGLTVSGQATLPAFITDSLDAYVERSLATWDIPGAAVCVVYKDQVVVMKGYGVRELGKKEKVDENSLFMIASNTKAFTGTSIALLEYRKKCSLNDKINKWLPDFGMNDAWVTGHATLADMLSHRSGLETFQGDFMYFDSDFTSSDLIKNFRLIDPVYDFRSKWGYCNACFFMAGECISKISGEPWNVFIEKNFFQPLEMNRSLALADDMAKAENITSAHTLVNGKLQLIAYGDIDLVAPAASICSSVNDLSHWLICQLDSGRYNGREVIPYDVLRRTRQPLSIIGKGRHPFNHSNYTLYGMGWQLQDYEGTEIVSHTGGIHGYVTSVTLLPAKDLGIVVLTNTDQNYFYEALKWEILDAFLGLPYRDYSGRYNTYFKSYLAESEAEKKAWNDTIGMQLSMDLPLEKFAGTYHNPVYGWTRVVQKGKELELQFEHHPTLTGRLQPLKDDRFLCTYNLPLFGIKVIRFKTGDDKALSFTLRVADDVEFTTYEFVRQEGR